MVHSHCAQAPLADLPLAGLTVHRLGLKATVLLADEIRDLAFNNPAYKDTPQYVSCISVCVSVVIDVCEYTSARSGCVTVA